MTLLAFSKFIINYRKKNIVSARIAYFLEHSKRFSKPKKSIRKKERKKKSIRQKERKKERKNPYERKKERKNPYERKKERKKEEKNYELNSTLKNGNFLYCKSIFPFLFSNKKTICILWLLIAMRN